MKEMTCATAHHHPRGTASTDVTTASAPLRSVRTAARHSVAMDRPLLLTIVDDAPPPLPPPLSRRGVLPAQRTHAYETGWLAVPLCRR